MTRVGLPQAYKLEQVGQSLLLKRPKGYVLAAFMEGVKPEDILRVAITDQKYLAALETAEGYSLGADAETVLLFSEDIDQARKEFIRALEAAYRGSSDAW
jgi:hypothetical protein